SPRPSASPPPASALPPPPGSDSTRAASSRRRGQSRSQVSRPAWTPRGDSLGPPEQERRADRLALAEWVDLDEPDVQRQLDRRIVYLRQRGLGLGQIVEEGLEQLTSGRVGHHLGVRILREEFLDLGRWSEDCLLLTAAG